MRGLPTHLRRLHPANQPIRESRALHSSARLWCQRPGRGGQLKTRGQLKTGPQGRKARGASIRTWALQVTAEPGLVTACGGDQGPVPPRRSLMRVRFNPEGKAASPQGQRGTRGSPASRRPRGRLQPVRRGRAGRTPVEPGVQEALEASPRARQGPWGPLGAGGTDSSPPPAPSPEAAPAPASLSSHIALISYNLSFSISPPRDWGARKSPRK